MSYQAMSSTRTQSQLCTATPISSFAQCPISFRPLPSSVTTFIWIEVFLKFSDMCMCVCVCQFYFNTSGAYFVSLLNCSFNCFFLQFVNKNFLISFSYRFDSQMLASHHSVNLLFLLEGLNFPPNFQKRVCWQDVNFWRGLLGKRGWHFLGGLQFLH